MEFAGRRGGWVYLKGEGEGAGGGDGMCKGGEESAMVDLDVLMAMVRA